MFKFLFALCVVISCVAQADNEDVLSIDRSISTNIHLSFPNDNHIEPKKGDFAVISYVPMSNDIGERWSVITLTNLSTGARQFDQTHLIALFADGRRSHPLRYKLHFKGKETQSITVSFGQSKFPILSVYSSHQL